MCDESTVRGRSLLLAWLGLGLAACAASPVLNSDRIEQTFGNYGVEVLEAEQRTRVSCLYSEAEGVRTCRTIALVEFRDPIPAAAASAHERILAGGSIGAVFRDAGWRIGKSGDRVEASPLPPALQRYAPRMGIPATLPLAAHRYVFQVRRRSGWHDYAEITEFHHPDYLTLDELTAIYVRE